MAHQFLVSCTVTSRDFIIKYFAFVLLLLFLWTINNFLAKSSNKYDKGIKSNVDKAKNIALDRLKVENSDQNLIGSVVNGLGTFLKTLVVSPLTGVLNIIPFLNDTIAGALDGGSKGLKNGQLLNGVFGILGGVGDGATKAFKRTTAKIGNNVLKGERNRLNIIFMGVVQCSHLW